MKKLAIPLIIILAFAVVLSACSPKDDLSSLELDFTDDSMAEPTHNFTTEPTDDVVDDLSTPEDSYATDNGEIISTDKDI